ncbi:MAG: transposase, partial [Bacteroidetes bacterium]|nr:transposase [Bacteroidota bacterium]
MKEHGADSISRYKHKTTFYDPISHEEIDLLSRLKQCGSLDMEVLAGTNKSTKLRIIAAPVPEEVANIRRMRAKKEAKKRGCSHELLQLMAWSIFITTIDDEDFTIRQACLLYSLRWRIECIFKTWKSNLNFDKIHNVSEVQLRVLLNARFIMITLLYERLYAPLEKLVFTKIHKHLSLMKFMHFISRNLESFIKQFFDDGKKDDAIKLLLRYCTFDKRKRKCFNEVVDLIVF